MTLGYLGIGSNVGNRLNNLRSAIAALPHHGVSVLASSSVYETEPVGLVLDQPDFLNACVRVRTELSAIELLDACKVVEREAGRAPGGARHAPRVIDVDLLLLGDLVLESPAPRLTLPHPELLARRFVLVPLLELDPSLTVPGSGARLDDALAALEAGQDVRLVEPPLGLPDQ